MSADRAQPHQQQQLSLAIDFGDTLPAQAHNEPIDETPLLCEIEAAEVLAKKLHRRSLSDVLTMAAVIEVILQGHFAGKGRGIHSKFDSSHHMIPTELDKRLRYIEAVCNKAVYEPAYEIPNRKQFLLLCEQAASDLVLLASKRRKQMPAVGNFWTRLANLVEYLGRSLAPGQSNALAH